MSWTWEHVDFVLTLFWSLSWLEHEKASFDYNIAFATYPQKFWHLRVERRGFDVLEKEGGYPLPQPLQVAPFNAPHQQVHLPVNQVHYILC